MNLIKLIISGPLASFPVEKTLGGEIILNLLPLFDYKLIQLTFSHLSEHVCDFCLITP